MVRNAFAGCTCKILKLPVFISFSKSMDQSLVFGGLLFGKLFTVLLDRLQTDTHLAYNLSKNEQEASDLIFGDNYDQHIEGKNY